jgi:hypothetical protein
MKSLVKLSFLVAVLFISVSAAARDRDFSLSFSNVSNKSLKFSISNSTNVSIDPVVISLVKN